MIYFLIKESFPSLKQFIFNQEESYKLFPINSELLRSLMSCKADISNAKF